METLKRRSGCHVMATSNTKQHIITAILNGEVPRRQVLDQTWYLVALSWNSGLESRLESADVMEVCCWRKEKGRGKNELYGSWFTRF